MRPPGELGWADRIVTHVWRDVPLVILDLAVVVVAYMAILVLRFDGAVPQHWWMRFWRFIPVAAFLHLVSNYLFRLYGPMWRYASVLEARRLVLAGATAALLVLAAAGFLAGDVRPVPLSVIILGSALSLMAFGAIRFRARLFAFRRRTMGDRRRRVLLVGAGDAGELVLKDLHRNAALGLDPVGVVDDDPRKLGRSLHGVRVLGSRTSIPSLARNLEVDQVLLTIPSATGDLVRDVAAKCEEAELPLRVLPSVREVMGGKVTARDIRDLKIDDLLGRQQVEIDLEAVRGLLRGRRVMITGAGGSIGSEIARQASAFGPSSLVLVDHDETHIHDVMSDVGQDATGVLADIRDRGRILEVFHRYHPEVVFHAAAHKHVPILEAQPEEAIRTNVLGTANVADAAVAAGAERFVLISTDKAISPVSVMGASKLLSEQIVRSLDGRECVFCAVRFGNVLGSRGSVIPTFLRQIAHGGPVTVTDPSMTRYFMSAQEAVQLVLQAAALSRGGEVFTLDMGEPVNILALARKLIHLAGRVPDRDVPIVIVGARPGEKLTEDMLDVDEERLPSDHPSIMVSRPSRPDQARVRWTLRRLEALDGGGRAEDLAERMIDLVFPAPVAAGRRA
jgi:FlaA1/EpsC-like NDP-sugar epimerase